MKSVLISIQPKWVEKICNQIGEENGKPIYEKVVEVRKTRPNLPTPFKCYIYQTKKFVPVDITDCANKFRPFLKRNQGKVIGEFVCDSVEKVNAKCSDYGIDLFYHDCMTKGCLTEREINKYFNIPEDKDLRVMKGNGYALHISDLKIYDKPKDLGYCKIMSENNMWTFYKEVETAPQSWMYIDKVGE